MMSASVYMSVVPQLINQEQRRRLLQEMCANDSLVFPGKNRSFDDIPNKELDHLIVDDRHGIIYCYVPKVGQHLRCDSHTLSQSWSSGRWFYCSNCRLIRFLLLARWRAATGSGS